MKSDRTIFNMEIRRTTCYTIDMKLIHTYLFVFSGLLFSYALHAQLSTNEAPALADNTGTQQTALTTIEQPASSNLTASADAETPVNAEAAAPSLTPTGTPFDKSLYTVILEKMPFGTPPDLTALNAAATSIDDAKMKVEQQKLAETFSWTAINITPDGRTAIGFTDLSAKPPANYYMTVGESANNWKVVEADYTAETATIEKGDDTNSVRISLKFGNKTPIAPTTPGALPTNPTPLGTPAISIAGNNHGRQHSPPQPIVETQVLALPADGGRPTATRHDLSPTTSFRDRAIERMEIKEKEKQEMDRKNKEELSKIVTDALRKEKEDAAAAAQQQGEGQQVQQIDIPAQ